MKTDLLKHDKDLESYLKRQAEAAYQQLYLLYKSLIIKAVYLEHQNQVALPLASPQTVFDDLILSSAIDSVNQLCKLSPADIAYDVVDSWEEDNWPADIKKDGDKFVITFLDNATD